MCASQTRPMEAAWLMWSFLFALAGLAIFTYGRRQRRGTPTLVGAALMIYPYFVSNTFVLIGVGALLILALFVGQRIEDGL